MKEGIVGVIVPKDFDIIFESMAKNLNMYKSYLIQTIICNQIKKHGYDEKFGLIKKLQHIDIIVYPINKNSTKDVKKIKFHLSAWHDAEIRKISNLNQTNISKTLRLILIDFIVDKMGEEYFLKSIDDELINAINCK